MGMIFELFWSVEGKDWVHACWPERGYVFHSGFALRIFLQRTNIFSASTLANLYSFSNINAIGSVERHLENRVANVPVFLDVF